ncbi:putative sister chromatid cohesion protein [Coniochaeta sp. 2T2.1]|nr:putative sister chromatid cohesion protein [Coniochaeta sp. 2T2.1]
MFYSHEILTSTQYGVATIWLVATIGPRSHTRKITRKAIQGVNIPRACDTIIQPGAPIALRLQSNLLYGVSRVYDQQCTYMLTDVEKVQSHMQTFYRVWGTSNIDPQAGKAKRDQLIIVDDPTFDLNFNLPDFRIDDDGNLYIGGTKDDTQMTTSQMSPHSANAVSSGSHRSPLGSFNIPSSPHGSQSANLRQLEMPFGRDSIMSQKPGDLGLGNLAEEEQIMMDDDWGIQIDEHGNVNLANEPELPQLPPPGNSDPPASDAQQQDVPAAALLEPDAVILDNLDDILPEGEAFPQQRHSDDPNFQPGSSSSASAPLPRQRKKPLIRPDADTQIPKAEINAEQAEYVARQDAIRQAAKDKPVTQAQARQYAYHITFGFGIGQVGRPIPGLPGLVHPLARVFAGPALQRAILGYSSEDRTQDQDQPQGHRRSSAEAGLDPDFPGRRVRPRLEVGTPQVGRAQDQFAQLRSDDDIPIFDLGDDVALNEEERGREAVPGSAESKLSAPWNRSHPGSSHHGGSSVLKATGPGRLASASPLHGRGGLFAIERLNSDDQAGGGDDGNPFGSDDFLGPGSHSSDHDRLSKTSQEMRDALVQDGKHFLRFLEKAAAVKGEKRDNGDGRTWIDFAALFEEDGNRTKAVVTQGFFCVLTLATRNLIKVEQEAPQEKSFGAIRVGVMVDEEEFFGEGVVVV